ncbi:MAG: cystathionine beta-lyase [Minwuiales bacterium]|nr:cystathionine beta-lyase [Minwuiales bacterium]
MKDETKIVVAGRDPEHNHGVVNPPVYHASTILRSSLAHLNEMAEKRYGDEPEMLYGRVGHPTALAFEEAMATLEGGFRCLAYPSGLAAISSSLLSFLQAGDHLLVSDSVYGPTRTFSDKVLSRYGVETTYYDPEIGAGIAELMRPNTRVVFTESPGSQTFEMQDIPAIAEVAHRNDAVVMMDNTWATPLFFKPLDYGVDISIQAATKYIVGHSDAMMGTVTTRREHFVQLRDTSQQLGQCAGPDDIYLAQRGLRTLSVRLHRHWENGLKIADWLAGRPEVTRVLHPALPGDPGYDLWKRDFKGAAGLFAFVVRPCSDTALGAMMDDLELFGMGYSWGGYESLMVPGHPQKFRTVKPFEDEGRLLRVHIGLEDPEDLMADLDAGFARLKAAD